MDVAKSQYFYDDSFTNVLASTKLSHESPNIDPLVCSWLIRCTPKRDLPYSISLCHIAQDEPHVLHYRISYNYFKKEYSVTIASPQKTAIRLCDGSILGLINGIKQLKEPFVFGTPALNTKIGALYVHYNQIQHYV